MLLVPVLTVVVGGFLGPGRFCGLGGRLKLQRYLKKTIQFYFLTRVKIGSGSGSALGV